MWKSSAYDLDEVDDHECSDGVETYDAWYDDGDTYSYDEWQQHSSGCSAGHGVRMIRCALDDGHDECRSSNLSLEDQYDCLEAVNEMCLGRGPQARAVTHDEVDIILDSGADVSALPLRFSSVGVRDDAASNMRYSDAQGNPLRVREFRIAEVRIGPCRFYERFALSNVTHPLICLGKLYRAGWFVRPENNVLKLSNDAQSVPIGYRHQSFCAQGTIRMLSRAEVDHVMSPPRARVSQSSSTQSGPVSHSSSTQSGPVSQSSSTQSGPVSQSSSTQSGSVSQADGARSGPGAGSVSVQPGSSPLQVRAIEVTLGTKLAGLERNRGWVKIAPSCYVLHSSSAHHVNTTLGPFDELLWRRTTLCRRSDRWYLEEYGEDVSALAGEGQLEKLFDAGEPVQSCLTFACNKADMSPEELGFAYSGDNYGVVLPAPAPASASPAGDDGMELSPPEAPVAPPAQAVQNADEQPPENPEGQLPADTVVIEGVRVTSESSATVLRAACTSLGLSKAGNRRQLWRRLTNHINSQQLLVDKHVEANLASSRARYPSAPAVAAEPDEATKARHRLTHEPYEPWCEICIKHRARQDAHATSVPHTSSENAVISFDYGFLSRKGQSLLSTKPEVGDESLTVLFCVDRASKAVFAIPTQSKAGAATSFLVTEAARFICWLGHSNVKLKSDNERPILHVMHHLQRALRSLNIGVTFETSPVGSHESNGEVEQALQRVRQHACVLISQLEEGAGMTKEVIKVGHPLFQGSVLHACWLLNRFRVQQNETAFERVRSSSYEGLCSVDLKGVWLGKTSRNDVNIIGTPAGIYVTRSVRRLANPWDLDLAVSVETCVWEHGLASLGSQLVLAKRVAPPAPVPVPVPAEVSSGPVVAPGENGVELAEDVAASPHDVAGSDPSSSNSSSRRSSDVAMSANDSFMSVADEAGGVGFSIRAVHQYGHEDESPELCFESELVEGFEDDDLQDEDWEEPEEVDLSEYEKQLMFPRDGDDPPSMPQDRLDAIDLVAEFVEVERLKKIGVLLDPSTLSGHSPGEVKHLTTRMVKDWREKVHQGKPIWLRRARYVAREFAWLCERSDTFAPASSCLLNRLLPILYATSTEPDKCLVAVDISDAFLTVDQSVPTEVVYRPTGGGPEVKFALGKLLPGQRDGSEKWYSAFLDRLSSSLDVEACEAYPTLLRTKALESVMQLHVDDMLSFTTLRYATEKLRPALLAKYKIKFEVLQKAGDVLWFLKRKLRLVAEGQLLISPHPKYLERLQRLLKIRSEARKKAPFLSDLEKLDGSPPLSPADSKLFRCCIGVLLYVAHDCIDCQYSINMLASKMSAPTELSMKGLRHLVAYMNGTCDEGLMLCNRGERVGLLGDHFDHDVLVETFSDANWAGDQVSRKSTSAGVIAVRANVLTTSSRTQRVIALSSGESELLASASVLSDAMLVRECVKFASGLNESPCIQHHVDSTAALGALRRQGVGKIRHLSTRILWQQLLVKQGVIATNKVSTDYNVADIGTKGLSRARTLFLKHLLHVYDEAEGEYVGEAEMSEQVEKEAMKEAVRRFRQSHQRAKVPKWQLRRIMIAALLSLPGADAVSPVDDTNALSPTSCFGSFVVPITVLVCAMLLQGCRSEQQWVNGFRL
ncbi:RE2 [Symbiodinium sp. CCMP2592]|nr:RE2 [Symbiodinium sp. CCMP2592]